MKKTLRFWKLYLLTSPFIVRMFQNNLWYFENIKNTFKILLSNTIRQCATVTEKLCNVSAYLKC